MPSLSPFATAHPFKTSPLAKLTRAGLFAVFCGLPAAGVSKVAVALNSIERQP